MQSMQLSLDYNRSERRLHKGFIKTNKGNKMTENLHYVTPDESADMACPMGFAAKNVFCVGPQCMAWRWAMQREEKIRSDGLKEYAEYSTTHGYCGMVRP
jgi:hypothetical protein